jgi:hypothetical protein
VSHQGAVGRGDPVPLYFAVSISPVSATSPEYAERALVVDDRFHARDAPYRAIGMATIRGPREGPRTRTPTQRHVVSLLRADRTCA